MTYQGTKHVIHARSADAAVLLCAYVMSCSAGCAEHSPLQLPEKEMVRAPGCASGDEQRTSSTP